MPAFALPRLRLPLVWLVPLLLTVHTVWAAPVTLTAADGVKVFGDYQAAAGAAPNAPLILAFHQAGSSRAEYAPLVPRLNQAGFHVLTIDQRSGGSEFGGRNQTVAALGRSAAYDAALPDLEAALAWAKAKTGAAGGAPVLVWGSSYSAALVFVLAARHPADVSGLLAFSPGEYLGKPTAVATAARRVQIPVFIDQADDAGEVEEAREILAALPGKTNTQFKPQHGVHGSATLRKDRNPAGAEENWKAVLAFLERFKTPK